MFELLTGQDPFHGAVFHQLAFKHVYDKPPTFAEANPHLCLSAALEAVVMKCLEKAPEDRYQSAAELRQAIVRACAVPSPLGNSKQSLPLLRTFKQSSVPERTNPTLPGQRLTKNESSPALNWGLAAAAIVGVSALATFAAVNLQHTADRKPPPPPTQTQVVPAPTTISAGQDVLPKEPAKEIAKPIETPTDKPVVSISAPPVAIKAPVKASARKPNLVKAKKRRPVFDALRGISKAPIKKPDPAPAKSLKPFDQLRLLHKSY